MYNSRWFMRIGTIGFNLLILNILWILITIVGLGVFGLFPATVALFSVTRSMIINNDYEKVIKKFFTSIKENWLEANLLGYLFSLILFVLYFNIKVIHLIEIRLLYVSVMSVTLIVGVLVIISFAYVFSVFVHFKFKWWRYPKYALILTIAKPFNTILLILLLVLVLYLYYIVPPLLFLQGMGLIVYIIMKIASFSFPKN
ncbi:YesL family protein [Amphibacillus indicireducens]|uniref:YesL family protein n=1 Tax=Amphibacillus indicireducens TaxID=1076330 RepID=UPI0031E895DB